MFTGIVESIGRLVDLAPAAEAVRARIATPLSSELAPGDSLAVEGVCLTVTASGDGEVHADIGPETARVTTLAGLRVGDMVNLERPMRLDSRVGGHLVLGHVDGLGTLEAIRPEGDHYWLTVSYPSRLAPLFIPKGSVAVNGISLTVAGLRDGQFDVQIVPFTWAHTTLHALQRAAAVNLECDVIGKYVARALECRL